MKVTIITAVFNCVDFIGSCIKSVTSQDYPDIEYLIIDGGSTDGTIGEIEKHMRYVHHFESSVDLGMYDALNKGIDMASGECIGILNADDIYAGADIISQIVAQFNLSGCDAVYGNLRFTTRRNLHVVTRTWNSRPYNLSDFRYGWMPPHPTLFVRRNVLQSSGFYSLEFGSCADYEMILRLLYKDKINAVFLDEVLVLMRQGGMSNGSVKKTFTAILDDYKVLVHSEMRNPLITLLLKRLRKITQLLPKLP